MKALVYNGPRDVRVKEVPDAKLERPTDVLVKITTTNICGSDLHMFEDEPTLSKARCVFRSTSVADSAKNCERGFTGFCLTVNPGNAGGAYGYAGMGPFNGGQPSTCACRTGISTACGFPRTRVRRRPIM